MMTMRFTSLAVLGFLFTLFALSDSIMNMQQAVATMMVANENGLGDTITIEQELFDASASRNQKLGGRKMVAGFELKKEIAKDAGPHGESSKISGEEKHFSRKSVGGSEGTMSTDEKSSNKLETQKLNSASMRVPLNMVNDLSEKSADHQDQHELFQKNESEKLLRATKEIVNLMHQDYRGMGKRKPPINNHLPLSGDDMKP